MSTIHFILQGKGGVGKSLVASLLYQYLKEQGISVFGVDTDPINSTFSGYKELSVEPLNIMEGDDINQRRFDTLMETIFQQSENGHVVIDNGAATFLPLCSYLKENKALDLLCNEGHEILFHTVITGGQAVVDTATGLKTLAVSFPTAPLVVWLNRYFGDISMNGKAFEEFKVYQENCAKFHAIIEIPCRKQSTFGKDLEDLFTRRSTFEGAINSNLPVMTRQRLKMFWSDVQKEISKAKLI
jgi:malate/lactate dehydrogenase